MRSKATQRIKDRKRIARRRRIVRLTNLRQPFGHAARLIQAQAAEERGLLWRALAWIGGQVADLMPAPPANQGPRKPDQKDWEQ